MTGYSAGLGHIERDFAAFGEASNPKLRAQQLDEGLEILTGLWTNDSFSFTGEHYTLNEVNLPARPVQSPRIPLWVVGGWPRRAPFRRAARWDGICFKAINHETGEWLTLDEFKTALAYTQAHRTHTTPFEVVMSGETPLDQEAAREKVCPFQDAGATWWVEGGYGFTLDEFRERIRNGPPQP